MAIWFPKTSDIEAAKVDLEKSDAIVVHRPRRGRDFQTPIGDSLDHRYAPMDHRHDDAAGEHEHDYLPLDGGTLTATLNGKLIKSYRDKGYAFEVKPAIEGEEDVTKAFIHTSGHASFTGNVKVDGTELAKVDHTHDDITGEIQGLQDAFDTAVLAAQEGAENLNIELQSYIKKDDANTSFLKLAGGSMTGGISIDKESGVGLQLFKNGTNNLKLWVDGGITTTKTTFDDNQLVTKAYVDNGYLQKSGGTMTGALDLDQEDTGSVFRVNHNGESNLKIYPSGIVETKQTSFDNNHLVSRSFTDSRYASKSHEHIKGDEPCIGPARYRWKYTSTMDPTDYHMSVEDLYIRLSILPSQPQVNWKVCDNHGDELDIDAELAIYSYSENTNGSSHRRYRWKLVGLARVSKVKYYVLNTGYFNRFFVRQWRKTFIRPSAEDTHLWVTIGGLLA